MYYIIVKSKLINDVRFTYVVRNNLNPRLNKKGFELYYENKQEEILNIPHPNIGEGDKLRVAQVIKLINYSGKVSLDDKIIFHILMASYSKKEEAINARNEVYQELFKEKPNSEYDIDIVEQEEFMSYLDDFAHLLENKKTLFFFQKEKFKRDIKNNIWRKKQIDKFAPFLVVLIAIIFSLIVIKWKKLQINEAFLFWNIFRMIPVVVVFNLSDCWIFIC